MISYHSMVLTIIRFVVLPEVFTVSPQRSHTATFSLVVSWDNFGHEVISDMLIFNCNDFVILKRPNLPRCSAFSCSFISW